MKKLMILSTAFFCLSTMKFFLLRLDRFTQFLYTSSVIISLEFVFSNLRLTVSEDLLSLSVQKSPNLFAFRVLSLNFVTLRVTCVTANNGLPRSIMTHWRGRQTGRQAFSFRVIDSSSARVEERLTDNGVVVRHKSLWGSSRWAHNLWGRTWSPGDPTPQGQCAWLLST